MRVPSVIFDLVCSSADPASATEHKQVTHTSPYKHELAPFHLVLSLDARPVS